LIEDAKAKAEVHFYLYLLILIAKKLSIHSRKVIGSVSTSQPVKSI